MKTTTNHIHDELLNDEAATLADPLIINLATHAVALAEKTAPGTFSPNPALLGKLYGDLIAEAGRLARLRFVARMGERPNGMVCGYLDRETVLKDVAAVMRRATK